MFFVKRRSVSCDTNGGIHVWIYIALCTDFYTPGISIPATMSSVAITIEKNEKNSCYRYNPFCLLTPAMAVSARALNSYIHYSCMWVVRTCAPALHVHTAQQPRDTSKQTATWQHGVKKHTINKETIDALGCRPRLMWFGRGRGEVVDIMPTNYRILPYRCWATTTTNGSSSNHSHTIEPCTWSLRTFCAKHLATIELEPSCARFERRIRSPFN